MGAGSLHPPGLSPCKSPAQQLCVRCKDSGRAACACASPARPRRAAPQGWCFALPTFLFRLPYALLDSTLWSLIVYWAVGFDNSWRFLVFWLFMFLTITWWVWAAGWIIDCLIDLTDWLADMIE